MCIRDSDELLQTALDYFREKDKSLQSLVTSLRQSFAEENAIIMNGTTDNTKEKQLAVNSLEERDNPYRIIFTVDMLKDVYKRQLVNLMGTSAWYAPGSAAAQMVEAIIMDQKRIFPCCVKLEGEFGLNDMFVGSPVKLGKNGVEQIIEIPLNEEETKLLHDSAKAVKSIMDVLDGMNIL